MYVVMVDSKARREMFSSVLYSIDEKSPTDDAVFTSVFEFLESLTILIQEDQVSCPDGLNVELTT